LNISLNGVEGESERERSFDEWRRRDFDGEK
jgi:hypothetical protein